MYKHTHASVGVCVCVLCMHVWMQGRMDGGMYRYGCLWMLDLLRRLWVIWDTSCVCACVCVSTWCMAECLILFTSIYFWMQLCSGQSY